MRSALLACLTLSCACAPDVVDGPPFSMSFSREGSLFDAPFPSDDLLREDGTVDVSGVTNPNNAGVVASALDIVARDARGFSQAGAVYLRAGARVDRASLPDLFGSVRDDASVFLVDVGTGARVPVDVAFLDDGGPFGDARLLSLLPLQGAPLRARTTYAAVVTRALRYADGSAPAPAPVLDELRAGKTPDGMSAAVAASYRAALDTLGDDVAALAVFTTDDRAADLSLFLDDALAHHPVAPPATPALTDTFDGYCVFQSTVDLPDYQSGVPPYSQSGGAWRVDDAGAPAFDHEETGRIFITVPRGPMPATGWPTVVFIGTGAGGERALVDRGVCATPDFTAPVVPGSGPAQEFARVGWAAVQIDGALEGLRNTTGGNEDFLVFNVFNPPALRDNIRQSALELALLPPMLAALHFDASACDGAAGTFAVDGDKLALMGHSMGAAIAPLVLAAQPAFHTAVLSGAGSSYIANIMDKQRPLVVRPVAEQLLGYTASGRALEAHDPALTLFQWAAEPSDAQIYDDVIVRAPRSGTQPRNVLMLQGIVDHYILPSIAEATSLSMGLDLAGPAIDDGDELAALDQRPLETLLPLVGRAALPLPASGNAGDHTAVVVQNPGDDVEDGHEVNFQTERPKAEYRCFLEDVAAGRVPVVRAGDSADPCLR